MTQRIPLTQGLYALVDDEDYPAVVGLSWCAMRTRHTFYAYRSGSVLMHRMLCPGWPQVDHANGDGLDNRRANLRPASHSQNQANRPKAPGSSSQFKGVQLFRRTGKWRARIKIDGLEHHLGYFMVEADAARAYDGQTRNRG